MSRDLDAWSRTSHTSSIVTFAPPRPPSPAEREALIREARERQRRRRLLGAASVAIVAAVTMAAYSVLGLGAGRRAAPAGGENQPLCGPACARSADQELVAVMGVYYRRDSFDGSGLLRVDPRTLRPLERHPLRLGDAVATQVLSPGGDRVALGGINMGEILFADRSLRHLSQLILVPHWQHHNTVEVDAEAWPVPSRLIAVATLDMAPWWAPKPSELFVVDPASRRVVRRLPLHGTFESAVSVRNGTTALLVEHGRSSRIVVVTPQGSTWSLSLRGLDLRGGGSVRVEGTSYAPRREPALATDGSDRVFVVAADRPIGEIRLRERELRYHRVALPRTYFSYPRPEAPGTAGVALSFGASATWLGSGMLAIGGGDELPVAHSGEPGGAWLRYPQREIEIVDTRSWRRTRAIPASVCERAGAVTLCNETVTGLGSHGKGARGPSIAAYDGNWHRLWANPSTRLGWVVTAGRLLVWPFSGSRTTELNPATGRVLRRVGAAVGVQNPYSDGLPTLFALPRR